MSKIAAAIGWTTGMAANVLSLAAEATMLPASEAMLPISCAGGVWFFLWGWLNPGALARDLGGVDALPHSPWWLLLGAGVYVVGFLVAVWWIGFVRWISSLALFVLLLIAFGLLFNDRDHPMAHFDYPFDRNFLLSVAALAAAAVLFWWRRRAWSDLLR